MPLLLNATVEAPSWPEYFAHQAEHSRDPALQRFYAAGLPGAETPLSEVAFMALDFETTGMNPRRDSIVSIGMVPFTLQRIRPAAGRYWVVRPPGGLSRRSVEIHHITHTEVASAPDLELVLDEVLAELSGHIPVVHYRGIERPFLDGAVLARRGEHCLFPLIDTMELEAQQQRQGWAARLRRWLGLRQDSIRLSESRARYGLPAYTAHHAKVDALATAELFQAQVARHYSAETSLGELWC